MYVHSPYFWSSDINSFHDVHFVAGRKRQLDIMEKHMALSQPPHLMSTSLFFVYTAIAFQASCENNLRITHA